MHFVIYLQENFFLFLFISAILGLSIGSFLNVVIYRLPVLLQNNWKAQCRELLCLEKPATETSKPFNLIWPRSQCPQCQHALRALENVPLISYLLLKGKCAYCHKPISWRYPVVELLTAVLTIFLAWHYGISWHMLAATLFTYSLICLTFIDLDHQILPDNITLPLVWLGLTVNLFSLFTDIHSAVIGSIAGYLSLWSVNALFKLLTGRTGMGNGDFKLLAAIGAWLGWQSLPFIILLSSLLGAIVGVTWLVANRYHRYTPIPFGPYLAIIGWIGLIWGQSLTQFYLALFTR